MGHRLEPFIHQTEIRALVRRLGEQINSDYPKILQPDERLVMVVTLKGAFLFASDLAREIRVPLQLDFVRLASYGAGTKSSGEVRILKDIEQTPRGKHLLVVDEIVDSGRTLHFLKNRLLAEQPKSVKLCGLLGKPSRREIEIDVDYLGRNIEDRFVVGYGLDYAEDYRNLPDIHVLHLGG